MHEDSRKSVKFNEVKVGDVLFQGGMKDKALTVTAVNPRTVELEHRINAYVVDNITITALAFDELNYTKFPYDLRDCADTVVYPEDEIVESENDPCTHEILGFKVLNNGALRIVLRNNRPFAPNYIVPMNEHFYVALPDDEVEDIEDDIMDSHRELSVQFMRVAEAQRILDDALGRIQSYGRNYEENAEKLAFQYRQREASERLYAA